MGRCLLYATVVSQASLNPHERQGNHGFRFMQRKSSGQTPKRPERTTSQVRQVYFMSCEG